MLLNSPSVIHSFKSQWMEESLLFAFKLIVCVCAPPSCWLSKSTAIASNSYYSCMEETHAQAEDRVFLSCGKVQGLLLAVFKEQSLLLNKGSQNETQNKAKWQFLPE